MELGTVRDFINFNSENKPNLDFITCPNIQKKITNKNLKINLDKINYYLSVKKKQKKKFINLYTDRKFTKWDSTHVRNYVFWNDTSSSQFSGWRGTTSLHH